MRKSKNNHMARAFRKRAMEAVRDKAAGVLTREEAALDISSAGIGMGLHSDNYPACKRIIDLALDLEKPEDIYGGDPETDWRQMVSLLEEM